MIRLSAVIIARDEAANLGRCLDSLAGVADEVVVVDSGSTDGTAALCRARGARVVDRPFDGFTTQKNFALDQASHDHVLSLDADEALSPALREAILAAKADWRADGYDFNRLNHYGRKPIRTCGWYPDCKIRLWDRRRGRWAGGLVHETVELEAGARRGHLEGELLHFAYQEAGQLLAKMQTYSTLWARQNAGRRHVGPALVAVKAAAAFLKAWVLKGGFRDGYEGLLISASTAAGVLYNYAKLLELDRPRRISLVVTTYNRPDALELVLRSVRAQEELPDEVIVADDGSGEPTRALLERLAADFPVPLLHCWQEDQGFRLAAIRNRAMAMASGDYVIMVDGDIVLDRRFVRDHRRAARRGRWIQGGRVMLSQGVTGAALGTGRVAFGPLEPGTRNRKNAIHSAWASRLASRRSADVYMVRGANLAFWRHDVVEVNGFNEDFVGWGREDSEFAARMHHAGVERLHLRFAAVGYHLWHAEAVRHELARNQRLLDETLASRSVRCAHGMDRALAAAPRAGAGRGVQDGTAAPLQPEARTTADAGEGAASQRAEAVTVAAAAPLHLVEPTLAGEAGHELSFARSLCQAAAGHPVRVWAGSRAQLAGLPPWVTLERHFTRALRKVQAPLLYRRLLGEPGRVLVATAGRVDLIALDWAAGRRAIPPGKVCLYFHWFRDSPGKRRVFQRVARRHPGLRTLAPTESVAEILRACGFHGAEAVPYPITPVGPAPGAPPPFSHLLFAGAARQDKGFGRLVDLVELLSRRGEVLPVVYQRATRPERLEEASRRDLERLDRCGYPMLRAQPEPLPAAAYAIQFEGGIVLQAYRQTDFADRVSGVTLDALSAGCPVVTLAGTWMARVVERFGAGVVVAEAGPEALLAAIHQVLARYGELQAAALHGGRVLQEENSARRLWAAIMTDQPFRPPPLSARTRPP